MTLPNRPPLSEADDDLALLDIRDLQALLRLGETWIRGAVARGEFPKPALASHRANRWRRTDVRAWLERQAA